MITAQLQQLIDTAEPRCGAVRVIAVDGPSGSGKTSLADDIAQRWPATVVRVDELIPGWDGLAVAATLITDQILQPLSVGQPAGYRRWDWYTSDWADWVPVPATDILVIEGCGSSVPPAAQYAAVRVFVDAPWEVRLARGLARDGETYRPHWERWAAQERALFTAERTRQLADLTIWTGPPGSIQSRR